jgi:hypothetical protein
MCLEQGQTIGIKFRSQQVETEHFTLDAVVQPLLRVGVLLTHHHVASSRDHQVPRL